MATSGPYALGTVVRLSCNIQVSGTNTDPGAITLTIKTPDGVLTALSPLVHDSTGNFHFDYATTQTGTHYYRFVTTGTGSGANEASFSILKQETA